MPLVLDACCGPRMFWFDGADHRALFIDRRRESHRHPGGVIVIGPELKLHQCGLPKKMALDLFEPFIVKRLKDLGYVYTIRSAKKMIQKQAEKEGFVPLLERGQKDISFKVRFLFAKLPQRPLNLLGHGKNPRRKQAPQAECSAFLRTECRAFIPERIFQ